MALSACIESLCKQTIHADDYEIIIVDDGSSDPVDATIPAETITRAGQPEIRLVTQENTGPATARNHGASIARGAALAFIDDDCLAHPNWLEELLDESDRSKNALVGGHTRNALLDDPCATVNQLILDVVYEYHNRDVHNCVFLASNNWLCPRDMFLAIGGFDEAFRVASEDRDFCQRWRDSGFRIVWQKAAGVEHLHAQNVWKFLKMHFRYGRGALQYHSRYAKIKGGTSGSLLSFYVAFPRSAMRRVKRESRWAMRFQLAALLVAWQFANVCGFVFEMVRSVMPSTQSQSEHETNFIQDKKDAADKR